VVVVVVVGRGVVMVVVGVDKEGVGRGGETRGLERDTCSMEEEEEEKEEEQEEEEEEERLGL